MIYFRCEYETIGDGIMKLGFVSAILPDKTFEEVIDFAALTGYRSVEVMCWPTGKAERRYAGVTHIDLDQLSEAQAKKIIDYTAGKGIEISALSYYPNPMDSDLEKRSTVIAHLKKIIKNAGKLNIDTVNTFIGRDPKKSLSASMADFKTIWPDIIKVAEDNNVRIAIENCPMLFTEDEWPGGKNLGTTPAIWTDMFSIIPSKNFGLNYDPSHFIWQQVDYIQPVYDFKEKIFHAHIKDIKIDKDKLNRVGIMAVPLDYCSPKLPGYGDVDWAKYIAALKEVKYDGHVAIEVEDKDFENSLEDRMNALVVSKKYIDQFLV